MKKITGLLLVFALSMSCSSDDDSRESSNTNTNGNGNDTEETVTYDPSAQLSFTPCVNGKAGYFDCNGFDLISHIPLSFFNAGSANDSWGWTDPMTAKEYVLLGLSNGTAFIDISDSENPVYLGKLPSASFSSPWRDIKVYNNYAFIVSEGENHGMQVFDLTRLRDITNPPASFEMDAHFTNFGGAHNIAINEDVGYAYVLGSDSFSGGPYFINIQDPLNPIDEGGYGLDNYSHDAQVITYQGPDTDHTGKEIFFGSNENRFVIVDVTDKANPQNIASVTYLQTGFTHQGWFTQDQRYFLLGDEFDEIEFGFNARTIVWDLFDLDNPQFHFNYFGQTSSIDHNGYVKGNLFYQANYAGGMRVMDISDIGSQDIFEIGYFDTYPLNNGTSFDGVWNVYPFFNSGNIAISDIEKGLFIVRKN
ncbi:choice-of-anchor B family protein [Aureisphaera galaxeae]|uniref:choice-of-anchor B family protein n=1 Tax=Aureisphaera galaxeae TaxID=1538023 RepID=UPI0023500A75|nr:choice-of-anchor B family protein [Aureisphaera galaxeae]MDC8002618.1 choice-of-anchor B family protein [Aureisphaera galaxeae]